MIFFPTGWPNITIGPKSAVFCVWDDDPHLTFAKLSFSEGLKPQGGMVLLPADGFTLASDGKARSAYSEWMSQWGDDFSWCFFLDHYIGYVGWKMHPRKQGRDNLKLFDVLHWPLLFWHVWILYEYLYCTVALYSIKQQNSLDCEQSRQYSSRGMPCYTVPYLVLGRHEHSNFYKDGKVKFHQNSGTLQ